MWRPQRGEYLVATRFPAPIALTVSASLAQIGEFSFILASLGTSLGLLPTQGRDLIVAGAILSIALNPLGFAAIRPLTRWLEQHSAGASQQSAKVEHREFATDVSPVSQRDHVVVVGFGRVGTIIGSVLTGAGVPFTVVEYDRRLAEGLGGRKLHALRGEAMAESVLEAAGVRYARVLVLAIPTDVRRVESWRLHVVSIRASRLPFAPTLSQNTHIFRTSGLASWYWASAS
jgi:CPA2 family monovalent cation:H+ antiporter-2